MIPIKTLIYVHTLRSPIFPCKRGQTSQTFSPKVSTGLLTQQTRMKAHNGRHWGITGQTDLSCLKVTSVFSKQEAADTSPATIQPLKADATAFCQSKHRLQFSPHYLHEASSTEEPFPSQTLPGRADITFCDIYS